MNTPVLCDYKLLDIVKEQSKRPCLIYQDVKFEKPTQIGFIIFRNFYCSHVSIKYKAQNGTLITLLSKYQLMENPNYENESQNYVRINCHKEFSSAYKKDMVFNNLRFYYYQTSPNWNSFQLTNYSFYKPLLFHHPEQNVVADQNVALQKVGRLNDESVKAIVGLVVVKEK